MADAVVVLPGTLERLEHRKPTVHRDFVEITIGFLGDPALFDDIAIDSEDDRHASNP
jgi:hypothetical protein